MKGIIKCILLLIFSITSKSAVSQGINFQGVARSENGIIIASSNISLRLSIISKNVDATPEYIESKKVGTNTQGIFSVIVGDSTGASTAGNFKNINWSDGIKFLKVEMDPSAGSNYINMGTTQLQYVPYSFFSMGVDGSNIRGIISVKSGGTGVASLQELKTALSIDKIDNTSDTLKPISVETKKSLNTKLNTIDTVSLSNRINELSNKLNVNSSLPNGIRKGSTAIWNGEKWIVDTNIINDGQRVNIGSGKVVDSSAILDINSNNSGILIPRLTESQRNGIKNPTDGLMIYCKDYYGTDKGGALQIWTGGKWLTLFSYRPTDSTDDCPSFLNIYVNGAPVIDSTIKIMYEQENLDFSVSDTPLIKWYTQVTKIINNQSSLVYEQIFSANTNSYKIRAEDKNLKTVVIPRNKVGASCLFGDSTIRYFKVLSNNLSISSPISNWQSTIDSLLQKSFPNKIAPDLLTDNIMYLTANSDIQKYSNELWSKLYDNLYKITYLIESFPTTVPDSLKDIYGQLLTLSSINYFYLLRAYSSSSLGVPILSIKNGASDGNLSRESISNNYIKIINDLDIARSYLNNFTDSRRISKLFANILKSKVRIYQASNNLVPINLIIDENNALISQFGLNAKQLFPASNYINLYNDTSSFNNSDDIVLQYSLKNNNLLGYLTNSISNIPRGYEISSEGLGLFSSNDIRKKFIVRKQTDNKDYYNKYLYDNNNGKYGQSYAKVMTLSEFYLIVAEAYARNGNTTSGTVNNLNKVITARDTTATAIVVGSLSTTDLMNRILSERRKELFMEGEYYFDYKRFRNGISGLSNYLTYPIRVSVNPQYTSLPIPASVLSNNQLIIQNPGW